MKSTFRLLLLMVLSSSIVWAQGNNGNGNGGCGVGQQTNGCGGQGGNGGDGGQGGSSTSSSSSKATGVGVGIGIGTGGHSEATGGSVKDSGNSSVKDSGNSHNTNVLGQGQEQSQGQDQNQAAVSDAKASNSIALTENVAAPKIPVSTSYAPAAVATVTCFKSYSGGGQASNFGFSIGGGKIDETCQQLEVARSFAISGARKAYCEVMISTKWAKKAHVTMDDCMLQDAPPQAAASMPPSPVTPTPAVVIANPRLTQ